MRQIKDRAHSLLSTDVRRVLVSFLVISVSMVFFSAFGSTNFATGATGDPLGTFSSIAYNGRLAGWAIDLDTPADLTTVKFYADGPQGIGTLVASIVTDDTNDTINTKYKTTGTHGFKWNMPDGYKTSSHTWYVYAVDSTNPKTEIQLAGSPKTFPGAANCTLSGPSVAAPGSTLTLSWITTGDPKNAYLSYKDSFGANINTAITSYPTGSLTITAPDTNGAYTVYMVVRDSNTVSTRCDLSVEVSDFPPPSISPAPGTYTSVVTVTLSATGTSQIRWRGTSNPIDCSTGTLYTGPFYIGVSRTLNTIACYPDGTSASMLYGYIIEIPPGKVTAIPAPDTFVDTQVVALASARAGSIRYTLDGTDPTCQSGIPYAGGVNVAYYRSTTASQPIGRVLKALGCNTYGSSAVATFNYIINQCTYGATAYDDGIPGLPALPHCWDETALYSAPANNGLAVFQSNIPKSANDPNYTYPATIGFARTAVQFTRTLGDTVGGVKKFWSVWGNRCHPTDTNSTLCTGANLEGNPTNAEGTIYRAFFTSLTKADTCTLSQTLSALGEQKSQTQQRLSAAELTLISSVSDMQTQAALLQSTSSKIAFLGSQQRLDTYLTEDVNRTQPWVGDTCYIPTESLSGSLATYIAGIWLDWEVQDSRTTAQTRSFFNNYTGAINTLSPKTQLTIMVNLWGAWGNMMSGVSTLGPLLLNKFNYVSLFLFPGGSQCNNRTDTVANRLNAQMQLVANGTPTSGQKKKMFIIADMSDDENLMYDTRQFILNNKLGGVFLWRNGAVQTDCSTTSPASYVQLVKDLLDMPEPSTNTIAQEEWPHEEVSGGGNTLIATISSSVQTFLDGLLSIFVL